MRTITNGIVGKLQLTLGVLALTAGGWVAQLVQAADPAPASTKLTLADAVELAREKQPAIAAAHATLSSTTIQREAAYSPTSVLAGGIIHVRRQQADLGVNIAHANIEQAELDTIHAVTRAYLMALYAEEQLKVAGDAAANLRVVGNSARTLVNAGSKNVSSDDVDRIGGYVLLAEARLVEARLGAGRAYAALKEAIGFDCYTDIALTGSTLTSYYDSTSQHVAKHGGRLDCKCVVAVAVKHRPELAQAGLFAEIAHLEIEAQGKSAPTYSRTFAATSDIHSKVLPATDMGSEYRPGALAPEMPVYMAGSKQERQCRAAALADRADAVAEKTRNLIALEAEEACVRFTEYGDQVALLRRAAAASAKVSSDARRAYVNDQMGTERMLTAQVVEATNLGMLNEALYKYANALAALQKATAGHVWDCLPPSK